MNRLTARQFTEARTFRIHALSTIFDCLFID